MTTYYNENDPKAAACLRALIVDDLIPAGEVDERSIEDVQPSDLAGFTQCHFFAGIGGWPLALRMAGWPDDRPVWTGSCPCQPFSAAGKGGGVADERHLWPAWFHLVDQCRPDNLFGEQVASKNGLGWLDLVQADLEGAGYACGPVDLCAAGVGAPHWRQRLWICAENMEHAPRDGRVEWRAEPEGWGARGRRTPDRVGDALDPQPQGFAGHGDDRNEPGRVDAPAAGSTAATGDASRGVGHSLVATRERHPGSVSGTQAPVDGTRVGVDGGLPLGPEHADPSVGGLALADGDRRFAGQPATAPSRHGHSSLPDGPDARRASPLGGFWRAADWLRCTDGKWRPVEPGTFPLADGVPDRVGLLRGYGNAIVPQVAAEVIGAYLDHDFDRYLIGLGSQVESA